MKPQTFDEYFATLEPGKHGIQALRQSADPTADFKALLAAAFLAGQKSSVPTAGDNDPRAGRDKPTDSDWA